MARGAVAGNKDDGTEHILETGDKITLAFAGNQVLPAAAATTFTDGTDF
jgi:phage-related tail protein